MKKLFQKFVPIVAECNQGQKRLGVKEGGNILYENIFRNMKNNPNIIQNNLFNSSRGLKKTFQFCSEIKNPLVLGGDHMIGAATVLASVKKDKEVKVIWIDAHADLNTYKSSLSKNRHGMPVAMCLGLEKYWWNDKSKIKLPFENLIYVGIRDLDQFEKETIKKYNIKVLTPKNAVNFINKSSDNFHISFDVDALDPYYLNSTGTTAEKGLSPSEVRKIILAALKKERLIGLDIVEFNSELGNYEKSIDTMSEIFKI